jgi:adenylate cyclase
VAAGALPLLTRVLSFWRDNGSPERLMKRTSWEGHGVWITLRTLTLPGEKLHVLVAIPESDLLADVIRERQRMALVLGVSLVVSVALAIWLASRYTRPVTQLVARSEAIERLELAEQTPVPSSVLEVKRLAGAQARMSAALESFSRYVPREVIAELIKQGEAARIGAHPAELTVLFSDIRRFTSISEHLSPDEVARYLSDYFDALHQIIERHLGTTDKFIGDALMAFWGAPRHDDQHALNAVRATLECDARLGDLNRAWKSEGRPEFLTTFGLASGSVVVGNVGARNRLNYTVLGNTVNVASRCVGLGRELGCSILALESVSDSTREEIEWRRLGPVTVRGISEPKMVCEPLGLKGVVAADRLAFRETYERALDAYLARDFATALKRLEPMASRDPQEPSVRYLIHRCHALEDKAPRDFKTEMLSFR